MPKLDATDSLQRRYHFPVAGRRDARQRIHWNELRAIMVRVDADYSATPFKAKISNAEQLRVHTMLVIGGRDVEGRGRNFAQFRPGVTGVGNPLHC